MPLFLLLHKTLPILKVIQPVAQQKTPQMFFRDASSLHFNLPKKRCNTVENALGGLSVEQCGIIYSFH